MFYYRLIDSGSSETRVFDEQSPSGSDYLAEVLTYFLTSLKYLDTWDLILFFS